MRWVSTAGAAICAVLCVGGCGGSDNRPASASGGSGGLVLVSIARPADAASVTSKIAAVPGVAASTPVLRTKAYVGRYQEPMYAIDPASFAAVTEARGFRPNQDVGGEDRPALETGAVVDRLRARPDAAFVANLRFHQLFLNPGDLLRLRLPDQRNQFQAAPFHVAGVSGSFASATGSTIVVANLDYVQRLTGAKGPDSYLVKVTGDPRAVAVEIAAATSAEGGRARTVRG